MKKLILSMAAAVLAVCSLSYVTVFGMQSEETIRSIAIGTSKVGIHGIIGEPDRSSGSGAKEEYDVKDASRAVLQYNEDMLEFGFIVTE